MEKADAKLDALDLKILEVLQADGRISNVDLAERISLSAPQAFRRVKALEERGVVRGYRADVQPQALGLHVTAFVNLSIDGNAFARVRDIERQLRDCPQVLEMHTMSGDHDYLLKVVAKDLQNLSRFITDWLMQVDGVANVHSHICLEELKASAPLPIGA